MEYAAQQAPPQHQPQLVHSQMQVQMHALQAQVQPAQVWPEPQVQPVQPEQQVHQHHASANLIHHSIHPSNVSQSQTAAPEVLSPKLEAEVPADS